jgi:hypothetical protein
VALNLGGVIRLTYAVRSDVGALTDPGAATLTITQPDGTLATPTVTLPPAVTGQLVVDFAPTQAGLHSVHWSTTGPITAEDDMFVVEAPARLLISVDEALAHLRAQGIITSDADREQLQWLCLAATEAVESDLSLAIVRRTVIETFDGGGYKLNLSTKPPRPTGSNPGSITITTVVEDGVTLSVGSYLLHKRGWCLYRGTSSSQVPWATGMENITVTYIPGCIDPPRVARRVALNVVQTVWQASQQAEHPFLDEVARRASLATLSTSVLPSLSGVEQQAYLALKSPGSISA